jgi:glycosyltransferase involved in cell wall biosynthesis
MTVTDSQPAVSIVTPVYNGERYLAQCVESVLAQTYQNWEYIIVNNSSSDRTSEIAAEYHARDRRIRLVNCSEFVGVIENHNRAFRLISPDSVYCKVVSADDWLLPECILRLVEKAEQNPRVGIVGSYAIHSKGIRWIGLPLDRSVFDGSEVCRLYLLGVLDSFATPSSVLYRSSLVRSRDAFFPGSMPNADLEAALIALESVDFAFVHQILSFLRIHKEAVSSDLFELSSFLHDRIQFLAEYGPMYLTDAERQGRERQLLSELYDSLAVGFVNLKGKEFWDYHLRRLTHAGHPFRRTRLAGAVCMKLLDLLLNPKLTTQRLRKRRRDGVETQEI